RPYRPQSALYSSSFTSRLLRFSVFFFQAEDGIRDRNVTGVQTCALPILSWLSLMEAHDALNAVEPTAAADAINIMTVHASKGLEFDAVAVPSLVVKDFPTEPRDKEGWM